MNLTRRSFLKAIGITSAVAAASPSLFIKETLATSKYWGFDPNQTYGDYVHVTCSVVKRKDDPVLIECLKICDEQIKEVIPPGKYRKKIRFIVENPGKPSRSDPLGQYGYFKWIYNPKHTTRSIEFK